MRLVGGKTKKKPTGKAYFLGAFIGCAHQAVRVTIPSSSFQQGTIGLPLVGAGTAAAGLAANLSTSQNGTVSRVG